VLAGLSTWLPLRPSAPAVGDDTIGAMEVAEARQVLEAGRTSTYAGQWQQVVFITQAKRIGLTLEQINDLLPIWDGVNCPATHDQISQLVESKRAEILERIQELQAFAEQLAQVSDSLHASPPPSACRPDMTCCVPISTTPSAPTPVAYLSVLESRRTSTRRS
jgi:hypothetical protein